MKTKLFVSLLLLIAAVAPGALAAPAGGDRNFHSGRGQLLVTPVDDPITNGLTIVMGVAIGSLFLHQEIATREKWGMVCGVVAMVCLSFA